MLHGDDNWLTSVHEYPMLVSYTDAAVPTTSVFCRVLVKLNLTRGLPLGTHPFQNGLPHLSNIWLWYFKLDKSFATNDHLNQ